MKILRTLFVAWACACGTLASAAAVATEESFHAALHRGSSAHPLQYSFADVYRLTVSGPALSGFPVAPSNDAPMRVAVTQAPAPAQFSVAAVPEQELWLLLLSGFALAAWVARRRLSYTF
jgi:hypothetical protein